MTIDIVGMEQNGKTIFDQREDVTFVLGEGADMNIPMGLELALEKIKKNEKVQILIKIEGIFHPIFKLPKSQGIIFTNILFRSFL